MTNDFTGFAVFDLETTGISVSHHHRIVEIGIVRLDEVHGRAKVHPTGRAHYTRSSRRNGSGGRTKCNPRVTKKVDILVVADPNTASGKAKKAREYGVRIIAERPFWQKLGVEVQ